MDKVIEEVARGCTGCQLSQNNLKTAALHAWEWSARPWQTYSPRFCGTINDLRNDVSVRCSYVFQMAQSDTMTTTSAARTIEELRKLQTTHGLPKQLVSVNGPQLTAEEFRAFVGSNSIKQIMITSPATSPPRRYPFRLRKPTEKLNL